MELISVISYHLIPTGAYYLSQTIECKTIWKKMAIQVLMDTTVFSHKAACTKDVHSIEGAGGVKKARERVEVLCSRLTH